MSRSAKNSDEEIDVKAGRKTRGPAGSGSVDSPLRRSSRVRTAVKQFESSPESAMSDASSVSKEQLTRTTRRRTGNMDPTVMEKTRSLRSRKNSAASDISDSMEIDVALTPTKKTRNITGSDMFNRSNSRSSKRFTRAGSEAKSSLPATRVTRRTRASSVGSKVEEHKTKLSTPVKMKQRSSILPSEATVVEEKEDHSLPNVEELNEMDFDKPSPKGTKELSISIEKLDVNHRNTSQKIEDAIHGKPNDENILEREESISTDTVTQSRSESLEHNTSEVLSQSTNADTLKELELKNENVLSNTLAKQDEDHSNKENQAANIINDSQSRDDTISNVSLQSPKPLSESNVNVSKLSKEKCRSPSIETAMYCHSKDASEVTIDAIVSIKQTITNSNTINNPTNTNEINALILDEDSDNMQKLEVSTDTESLNGETPHNESINKDIVHLEASMDDSILIVECTNYVSKSNDGKFIGISNQSLEPANKSSSKNKECDEDVDIKMDVSSEHIEKTTNTNGESEKDTINQAMATDNKHETTKEIDESNIPENVMETDTLDSKETDSPSELNYVTQSNSSDACLIKSTESCIVSKDDDATHNSQNIEETNNLLTNENKTQKSSDAHMSPRDSMSTNKNEDDVTDVVKSSRSSTVAETPAEFTEELPEKEKQQQKDSTLDEPLSSKKQSINKSESNEQKVAEADLETRKKNLESMEVDDNDSDTNTANLFQDIPVDERKEKNDDGDQSSIHSLSTERLGNQSETECDLIFVDREAWLAAENIRLEKEKELSDYDSDDTVLLKIQNDSTKAQNARKVDVSKDTSKLNDNKGKNLNTSNTNQSRQQEEFKDTKESKEQCTPKNNTSIRKSVEKKNISESHEETEKEDLNKSLTDTPLNKSKSKDVLKKQKSPNKSIQEMDNDLEKSSKIETAKRTSLNRFIESDSNSEDIFTPSKRNEKRQSSRDSLRKKIKSNESIESELARKKRSVTKKKFNKNFSTIVHIDSDSDGSKNNIESEDSESESVELPKFLFGRDSDDGDDDKSSKSIDSDIQREYNLHGDDDVKFSDDDVPGDECRASETESSDPDDNGSDLTDFVVDDDEVEEDEGEGSEDEIDIADVEEDEEAVEEQDEKIQSEEEMDGIEDEVQQEVTEEDEQEIINKTATNKSLDPSSKRKSKLRQSVDTNLSETMESSKKEKRRSKADMSPSETNEDEHLFYSPLLNSFTMKRSNKKRVSIDNEQLLNNSKLLFNKNMHKLNKSMECSTPVNSSFQRKKFNVSLEAISVNLTNETKEIEQDDDTNINREEIENRTLGMGSSSKKLNKENVSNRSVPLKLSESVKLVEKINLSRPMPSKLTELHKTVPAPSAVSPTTIYLEKEKLSRSASELKLDIKSTKAITDNINNKQSRTLISLENANVNIDESDGEPTQEVNVPLRKKLLQVAENILEKDSQKKRKKRKKPTVTNKNSILFDQDNCKEDLPVVDNNNDAEILSNEKTKKRKKKNAARAVVEEPLIEDSWVDVVETKPKSKGGSIHNERKKNKKRRKIIENASESTSTNVKNKVSTKKKDKNEKMVVSSFEEIVEKSPNKKRKLLKDVASESKQVLVEKVPKKKLKLLKNTGSEGEEVFVEKLSKKKKKLSNDVTSQNVESAAEKLPKKKQKVLSKDAQHEEILVKKLPKKRQKDKGKLAVSSKSHQSRVAELDSDEGPEVVAFSEARNKALEVIKRTTSTVKTNKELKKKSQREHAPQMQNEEEMISKTSMKRFPDEDLENLSDVPLKSFKRRKLSKFQEQVLPSRSMSDSKAKEEIAGVDVEGFISSSYGSTTQFRVVNLQKLKKKKKDSEVVAFRQKMLTRNSRQPISAYLMYIEKQKVSGKSKFCNTPY